MKRDRVRQLAMLTSGFIVAVFCVSVYFYFPFTVDDAYIVARYAENYADHGKLWFNAGEPINALTSPLHAGVEVALYRGFGDTLTSYKLLALGLLVASTVLVCQAFVRDHVTRAFILATMLLSPSVLVWTFGGLETPILFFSVVILSRLIYQTRAFGTRRLCLLTFLTGLCFVTRYDSVLFTMPVVYAALRSASRPRTRIAALAAGMIVPVAWLATAWTFYGDLLPTSYYAKVPSVTLGLLGANLLYVLQNLIFVGLVPAAALLAATTHSGVDAIEEAGPFRRVWPLYTGILLVLLYGLVVAQVHMMFSFRFFVPFLPAAVLIVADGFHRRISLARLRTPGIGFEATAVLFVMVLVLAQAFQLRNTYVNSLNPVLVGDVEDNTLSAKTHIGAMRLLLLGAKDIEAHWQQLPLSRQRLPRIATAAAGVLPYHIRNSYVYEALVSYRHHCTYDLKLSADYIHILAPGNGSIAEQLPKAVERYQLISSVPWPFDGTPQFLLIYYDAQPDENHLPPRIDGACL